MPRRTQKDLRKLVEYENGDSVEESRVDRLHQHGWVDEDGLTDTGADMVRLAEALLSRNKLDYVLDMVGLPEFIGIAEEWNVPAALYKIAALNAVKAVIDEMVESSENNFGLIDDVDPVRSIGYCDPQYSDTVIRDAIQLTVEPEADILGRIERKLENKGYVCVRQPDARTKSGKSSYKTEIYGLDDTEKGREAQRGRAR